MKGHWIWMVIGCGLPLLLIFFAPALGITGNSWLFAFIFLLFVFHLIMPHGEHGRGGPEHDAHGRPTENSDPERGKEEHIEGTNEEHKELSHH